MRRRVAASDAQRLKRLRAGGDLDEQGLPFGTIPAAFIDSRDDARLVFPNSQEIFRKVERGAGSMLATVLSFDSPQVARVLAGYLAPATSTAVLAWYSSALQGRGWRQPAMSRDARSRSDAVVVFHRGVREWISVTIPGAPRAQRILDGGGLSRCLAPGRTVYVFDYQIGVAQRPTRGVHVSVDPQ